MVKDLEYYNKNLEISLMKLQIYKNYINLESSTLEILFLFGT